MPMSTMLNAESSSPVALASTRTWAAISPGREVAHETHLAGEAEGAAHGAAHLRRHAEGLRRRVGDVDALDLPAVGEAEHEFPGAVFRDVLPDDRRASRARARRPAWRAGRARGRSSASKLVAPRFQTQAKICRARNRGNPRATTHASRSARLSSARSGGASRCTGISRALCDLREGSSVASAPRRLTAACRPLHAVNAHDMIGPNSFPVNTLEVFQTREVRPPSCPTPPSDVRSCPTDFAWSPNACRTCAP